MNPFDWTRLFTRPYKVYTQALFWVIVFFLYIVLKEYPVRMSGITLVCLVLQETLELLIPSYSQNLLILPLFRRRKYIAAISLYLVQLFLLVALLPYILNAVGWLFGVLFHITDLVDWRKEHITFSMVAFTVIATFTKIALDRLITDKQQKENELRHLKGQLNPHFLFNTLNNLYGLSVSGSKKLPDLMLKLSDLLRYSLYDTNQHYVSLQKEIDYIGNYVELERIRLGEQADVRFCVEGDPRGQYIAPLLMIVFIENAFKHLFGRPAYVHIQVSVGETELSMSVKNSADPTPLPPRSGGLGLKIVRQRLDLIYPEQYRLIVHKGADKFETHLQIELTCK